MYKVAFVIIIIIIIIIIIQFASNAIVRPAVVSAFTPVKKKRKLVFHSGGI
jgi:Na+-transporting methylmalonyl-CoA/oxaloacetate decarboxylase gamma subunit